MANLYHANFRCDDPRPGRAAKSFRFYAASDAAAAAVAAELGNWTSGQLTSLYKKVGGPGPTGGYASGSRITLQAILADASFNDWRVTVRNGTTAPGAGPGFAAACAGSAYVTGGVVVAALGSPPNLPNSGNPVSVVKAYSVITKY